MHKKSCKIALSDATSQQYNKKVDICSKKQIKKSLDYLINASLQLSLFKTYIFNNFKPSYLVIIFFFFTFLLFFAKSY